MKYFVRPRKDRISIIGLDADSVYEITKKAAWETYRNASPAGHENIVARPLFNKGLPAQGTFYNIWGENISNKELFKRRLQGEVAQEVLKK